ncbi:MAG: PHP domain-containing protein [Planctomycetota bacterium]|nr:PHP domain-containing protein [Planctomycetota bacterium]
MKVELHCHTSRYSACGRATPSELMERMIQIGYDAVYITEHDAVWNDWEIDQLQQGFPDIQIFGGVELSTGPERMQHLLVLGTTDRAYTKIDDVAEILEKARDEGHLTVLAHPFRWEGGAEMLDRGLRPDAIEYRTGNHDAICAGLSEAAAGQHSLPLVNVGDVHGLDFLNRFWIETNMPLQKADDIRTVVLKGAYDNCICGNQKSEI